MGPLIMRELIKADRTVVGITVGETDAAKYLNNTIDTLKSLESLSLSNEKVAGISYFENINGVPQKVIDEEALFTIESLIQLSSQDNQDLDVADVHHWLNYNNVCGTPAQLSCIQIFDNRQAANAALEPISILSLYTDRDDYAIVGNPHFYKAGYPNSEVNFEQLHFVVNTIGIDEIMKHLNGRKTAMAQQFSQYRTRKAIVSPKDDNVTSEDMVL